jgi:hypothetical protein
MLLSVGLQQWVLFSVISVLIAGAWLDSYLVGFYLWIASPLSLLLGNLNECLQKRHVAGLDNQE